MEYRVLTSVYGSTSDKVIWSDTRIPHTIGSIITRNFKPVGIFAKMSNVSHISLDGRVVKNLPKEAYVQDGIVFFTTKEPMKAIDWMLGNE